jgi:hypothetical protein
VPAVLPPVAPKKKRAPRKKSTQFGGARAASEA